MKREREKKGKSAWHVVNDGKLYSFQRAAKPVARPVYIAPLDECRGGASLMNNVVVPDGHRCCTEEGHLKVDGVADFVFECQLSEKAVRSPALRRD